VFAGGDGAFLERDSTHENALGVYTSEDEDPSRIDGKIFPIM
jgi:hypothetical protein